MASSCALLAIKTSRLKADVDFEFNKNGSHYEALADTLAAEVPWPWLAPPARLRRRLALVTVAAAVKIVVSRV